MSLRKKKKKKRNFDIKSPSGCINPMEVELRGLNNSSHSVEDLIFSWRKVFFSPFLHMKFSHAVNWVSSERRQNATIASRAPTRSYRLSEAFLAGGRKRHADWNEWGDFLSPALPLPSPHPPPVSVQITAVLNTSKLPRAAQHFLEPSPVGNSKLNRLLNRSSLEIIC